MDIKIGPTIRRLRSEQGITLEDLCAKAGMPSYASNLSRVERGKGGTTLRILNKLAAALGTTPGQIFNEALGGAKAEANPQEVGQAPLLGWTQAGDWTESITVASADEWIQRPEHAGPRTFALEVKGESMTCEDGPSFPEGSIIFVDPDVEPRNKLFVVAVDITSGEATFKQLFEDSGVKILRPLNRDFRIDPPMQIDAFRKICGVVVDVSFKKIIPL